MFQFFGQRVFCSVTLLKTKHPKQRLLKELESERISIERILFLLWKHKYEDVGITSKSFGFLNYFFCEYEYFSSLIMNMTVNIVNCSSSYMLIAHLLLWLTNTIWTYKLLAINLRTSPVKKYFPYIYYQHYFHFISYGTSNMHFLCVSINTQQGHTKKKQNRDTRKNVVPTTKGNKSKRCNKRKTNWSLVLELFSIEHQK